MSGFANPLNLSTMTSLLLEDHPSPGVTRLTMNRPEVMNALSLPLQEALSAAFARLGQDKDTRVIVLTGAGEHFAAGGDINSLAGCGPIEIWQRHTELLWAPIQDCPKPVIAAVDGFALGGGCELAMHCDIILASDRAQFGQPEIKIGIMPGIGGTQRLLRAVGRHKAMLMLLSGQPISAGQAERAGLVSECVPTAELEAHALALAARIAGMPPLAVLQIKEVMQLGADLSLQGALALERKANQVLFASRDQKEGMQAFIEKRRPEWKGQ
jgi:enoyl-CoA hydratase